jgi:hypothetical protein
LPAPITTRIKTALGINLERIRSTSADRLGKNESRKNDRENRTSLKRKSVNAISSMKKNNSLKTPSRQPESLPRSSRGLIKRRHDEKKVL